MSCKYGTHFSGGKLDEPPKGESGDRFDAIPSAVITNNHNSTDATEPSFSDEESDPVVEKTIKIEEEEDEAPTGTAGNKIYFA